MKSPVTCIIPYYKEGGRMFDICDQLKNSRYIQQIICVDDGSNDNMFSIFQKKYPRFQFITLKQNTGKTAAVCAGLQFVKTELVMLVDADLQNFKISDYDKAVEKIMDHPEIDMIVMKRVNAPAYIRWMHGDVMTSGERIIKTKELWAALKLRPKGYELEMALNKYMMNNKKLTYWMPSSSRNTSKFEKFGFSGFLEDLKIIHSIILFASIRNTLMQYLFFCRKSAYFLERSKYRTK